MHVTSVNVLVLFRENAVDKYATSAKGTGWLILWSLFGLLIPGLVCIPLYFGTTRGAGTHTFNAVRTMALICIILYPVMFVLIVAMVLFSIANMFEWYERLTFNDTFRDYVGIRCFRYGIHFRF